MPPNHAPRTRPSRFRCKRVPWAGSPSWVVRMKTNHVFALIAWALKGGLFVTFLFCCAFDVAADENWQMLASNAWATVSVERTLYEKAGHQNFFVHVIVANQTKRKVGVDLSSYWKVIRPNQWGMNEQNHRGVINEKRLSRAKLDDITRERLKTAYDAGTLKLVDPQAKVDYYVNFNASGRKDIEKLQGRYCLVIMDGEIFFTDGRDVEVLSLWEQEQAREVAISTPIIWKSLPKDATLVLD